MGALNTVGVAGVSGPFSFASPPAASAEPAVSLPVVVVVVWVAVVVWVVAGMSVVWVVAATAPSWVAVEATVRLDTSCWSTGFSEIFSESTASLDGRSFCGVVAVATADGALRAGAGGGSEGFWPTGRAGCASSSAVALLVRQQRKTVNKRPIPPGLRVRPPDLTLLVLSPSARLRFLLLPVEALSLMAAAGAVAVLAVDVGERSDIFVDEERAGTSSNEPL